MLHDGLLAPLLIVLGAVTVKVVPVRLRGVVSVGLVGRWGPCCSWRSQSSSPRTVRSRTRTILPLNYVAGLLVTEAVILLLTAAAAAVVATRARR